MDLTERLAPEALTRPGSDRVRAVASLARRSARSRSGLFLAEGPQCTREALRAHLGEIGGAARTSWAQDEAVVDAVYVTASALERHPDIGRLLERLLDPVPGRRPPVRLVSDPVLRAMSDTEHPQGILAVCRVPRTAWDVIAASAPQLVAVLCRVQDPGNAGTVLRAADAAGADAVVLTPGTVDPFQPKVVRSTAGSLFHLPVAVGVDVERLAATPALHLVAADGYGAVDLDQLQDAAVTGAPADVDLRLPTAWLFGNEAQGLSDLEKSVAACRVAVPLHGAAESLNVGTAAALCLYASARAQRRARSESA